MGSDVYISPAGQVGQVVCTCGCTYSNDIYQPIRIYLFIYLSIRLYICIICICSYLSIYLFIYLSIYLSLYRSIYDWGGSANKPQTNNQGAGTCSQKNVCI